jgi:type III secretion system low calcium response chaperone LcrH/SycD
MKGERHEIEKATEALASKNATTASTPSLIEGLADKLMGKGGAPKEAFGLSDQAIEGIYGQAYRLYNTGKYKDASQLFRLLITLNPTEPKYTLGLAACFHMMKEYSTAAEVYTIGGVLDPQSPIPHYHASDCYLQMDDKISAIIALEMAVKRAGERAEFQQLKDRALLTIKSLKEALTKPKEL